MYHPYLVCKLFGMPSLHLFTFVMFFKSCFRYIAYGSKSDVAEKMGYKRNGTELTGTLCGCFFMIVSTSRFLLSVDRDNTGSRLIEPKLIGQGNNFLCICNRYMYLCGFFQ